MVYICFRLNCTGVIMQLLRKNNDPLPRRRGLSPVTLTNVHIKFPTASFQGHPRSSQPTCIDRPPMTSYWRSTATIGLSPTKSKKATHWPKIAIITTQPLFHATAEKFPWELGDGTWTQNMNDGVTCPGRKFDDIFSRLDTIYRIRVWQTDRQIDRHRPTYLAYT